MCQRPKGGKKTGFILVKKKGGEKKKKKKKYEVHNTPNSFVARG